MTTLDQIHKMDRKNSIFNQDSSSSSQRRLLSASISLNSNETPDDFLLPDLNKEVEIQLNKVQKKHQQKVLLPHLVVSHKA
jgi:hypothetical protein